MAPKLGFDEQTIEFGPILFGQNDRKPGDPIVYFGDDDLPALDLLGGKGNGVGIGLQLVAVFIEGQRGASLQLLKLQPLFRLGRPDMQLVHPLNVL